MDSILTHGLGWSGAEQNWVCDPGVYLSAHPSLSIFVMYQHYVQQGDPRSVPRDEFADMCIIVIDDSRVDTHRLGPDPDIQRDDVWLYPGVIDVRNQPVLTIEEAMLLPFPETMRE